MIQIIVNGKEIEVDVERLDQLIRSYKLQEDHVVAEVDEEIVERSKWKEFELKPGLKIELVHFVGGG